MGGEKIEIKRTENPASRQATFSKRRAGLLRKAKELSILCDADVAVLMFSSSGKFFDYASSDMKTILDRYMTNSEKLSSPQSESRALVMCGDNNHNTNQDVQLAKLKLHGDQLRLMLKHRMGEDLEGLDTEQLQQLKEKMEVGMGRVRARKNQCMLSRTKDLMEESQSLRRKVQRKVQDVVNNDYLTAAPDAKRLHS